MADQALKQGVVCAADRAERRTELPRRTQALAIEHMLMIPTQHSVYICAVRNEVQDMGANTTNTGKPPCKCVWLNA